MDRSELSVRFECNADDGSYIFEFPGERLQVAHDDVKRSVPLRTMIESAVASGETTFSFPTSVELTYLHIWAAALQTDAERMKRALEAADFLADEGSMQRLIVAYGAKLFPIDAVVLDADFLRGLEGMSGELARAVLAASSRPMGERAWRLPERLHYLDEAIAAAKTASKAQRASAQGQMVTNDLAAGGQVSASPDGVLFATCGRNGHVAVWHTATFDLVRTFECHILGRHFICHAWSPDSSLLATGCTRGTLQVWDVVTGVVKLTLDGRDVQSVTQRGSAARRQFAICRRSVTSVAWSPDGLKLCSGWTDGTATVWKLVTGDVLHVLSSRGPFSPSGHGPGASQDGGPATSVAWSPDGAYVAIGFEHSPVHIWDVATGRFVRKLKELFDNSYGCTSIAWSPDGRMLASALTRWAVRVWDVAAGHVTHVLHTHVGHTDSVTSVAWSPDGRHLATASEDKTVRVSEAAAHSVVRVISNIGGRVRSVAWSPCGSLLFASTAEAVHVWTTEFGSPRHIWYEYPFFCYDASPTAVQNFEKRRAAVVRRYVVALVYCGVLGPLLRIVGIVDIPMPRQVLFLVLFLGIIASLPHTLAGFCVALILLNFVLSVVP